MAVRKRNRSRERPVSTKKRRVTAQRGAKVVTIAEQCNALRPTLTPCPECGAQWDKLVFHTWHVGAGANVYCPECHLGTPMKHVSEIIANTGDGDGVKLAAELWNRYEVAKAGTLLRTEQEESGSADPEESERAT
jgi:hypothetical protein